MGLVYFVACDIALSIDVTNGAASVWPASGLLFGALLLVPARLVPAILAGNSVVLKMAPQTPLVAERYAEAFKAAGLPEGVFQFLHIDHDQVAEVIKDSRVGFVAFTGSVAGGHAVQRAAGERFIATGLELGGKDPAYVRPDAPTGATIENLVDGAMFNSGQSCCAVERVYVHRDVYDRFVEGFVEMTKQYKLGNPLDPATTLGPMVRADAADKARAHIADALKKEERDGEVGADESRRQLDQLQKITDRVIGDVDRLGDVKEQEVLEV